jgi:hypothetical protein
VLPPPKPLYLLNDPSKKDHGFLDFFDLQEIERHMPGTVIEFDEFVKREGAKFEGTDALGREPSMDQAKQFLRKNGEAVPYDTGRHCVVFGDERTNTNESPLDERVRGLCGGRQVQVFNPNTHEQHLLLHIQMNDQVRWLAHFYAFIMIPDLPYDRYIKRFVRDHMHYRPEIFCSAAKVVQALRDDKDALPGGKYNAFHIRRNDFQYEQAWVPAKGIREVTDDLMHDKDLVFIATDEHDHAFFQPFRDRYNVRQLKDYIDSGLLDGVNKNLYGMIDQIVASNAEVFVGTWWSTFTGYINRMRGYKGMAKKSWYYPKDWKFEMQTFRSPSDSAWYREFPVAWENIDE